MVADTERIFRLGSIKINRFTVMLEQVHRRCAIHPQCGGADFHVRRQCLREIQIQREFTGIQVRRKIDHTIDIKEQKAFREAKILLQDPVTHIGVFRVRQEGIIAFKAHWVKVKIRHRDGYPVDNQFSAFEIVVNPEIELRAGVVVFAQIKAQFIQLQVL